MKWLFIILGAVLLAFFTSIIAYGRVRRQHLAREMAALDRQGMEKILAETLTRLEGKYRGFSLDNFKEAVITIEREFRPGNQAFLSLLPREHFPDRFQDYWVIDMGILFGELVRRHSLSASDWTQDRTGTWELKFKLGSQYFRWNPFEEAERRYTGKTPDLLMALQLVQTLK
jgi:hypothetical protein